MYANTNTNTHCHPVPIDTTKPQSKKKSPNDGLYHRLGHMYVSFFLMFSLILLTFICFNGTQQYRRQQQQHHNCHLDASHHYHHHHHLNASKRDHHHFNIAVPNSHDDDKGRGSRCVCISSPRYVSFSIFSLY